MKNNLVLKIVIGVLIVTVAGLAVKLATIDHKIKTNLTETTTTLHVGDYIEANVETTEIGNYAHDINVIAAPTTTPPTTLSDSTCLDINKYSIPKLADSADIKIIQKALGVTPIGGNCGPKTQKVLDNFRNNHGMNYGGNVCILSQEFILAFNNKYCNEPIDKTTWINETPAAEQALRAFLNLAAAKNYTEAQKYFWINNSNATWLSWKANASSAGLKDLSEIGILKYMCEDFTGMATNIKEILKSEQTASNTYKFTIRLADKDGNTMRFAPPCCGNDEPGVDYTLVDITVRKIGTQFLVTDGFYYRS